MKRSRLIAYALGATVAVAAGLLWWLLSRPNPGTAPMAVVPQPAAPAVAQPGADAAEVASTPDMPVVSSRAGVPVQPSAVIVRTADAVTAKRPDVPDVGPAPAAQSKPVDEVAATERMYLAHAPLRDPEVADPDSETNRRILETMVLKALVPQSNGSARATSAAAN